MSTQRWSAVVGQTTSVAVACALFHGHLYVAGTLRDLARRNQQAVYNLLFRASAAALQELAWDPRFVGGQIGLVGVLHTWGRNLSYHPHVHYLVPAGGLSADGQQWLTARHNFLVPVKALSRLFRAKFRAGYKKHP